MNEAGHAPVCNLVKLVIHKWKQLAQPLGVLERGSASSQIGKARDSVLSPVSSLRPEPRTPLPEALIRFRIFLCFRLRRVGRGGGLLCGGGLLRGAALGSGSER